MFRIGFVDMSCKRVILPLMVVILSVAGVYAQEDRIEKVGNREYIVHSVKKRETIESMAFRYDVSKDDILRSNPTLSVSKYFKLKPGTIVRIPRSASHIETTQSDDIQNQSVSASQNSSTGPEPSYDEKSKWTSRSQSSASDKNKVSKPEIVKETAAVQSVSSGTSSKVVSAGFADKSSVVTVQDEGSSNDEVSDDSQRKSIFRKKPKKSRETVTAETLADDDSQAVDSNKEDRQTSSELSVQTSEDDEKTSGVEKTETNKDDDGEEDNDEIDLSHPFIDISRNPHQIRIAVILPFGKSAANDQNMSELYAGMVVAASDIKREKGCDVSLKVYSSNDLSDSRLEKIFSSSDVVVGPVFEDDFSTASKLALKYRKPIISPLSSFEIQNNPYVVMMPPLSSFKTGELGSILTEDKNVVLLQHTSYLNRSLDAEFRKAAPHAKIVSYQRELMTPQKLSALMDSEKENVILLPTDQQGAIEDMLSKITALNQPVKNYKISIIGSPTWMTLSNFTQELLFRGNVSCMTSYFFERSSDKIRDVHNEYLNAYERMPSRFSMRGYDVVSIIQESISRWGDRALINMDRADYTPLQTTYHFVRNDENGNMQNNHWVYVTYSDSYTIQVQ